MSGVLGAFGADGVPPGSAGVRPMLARLARRGRDASECRQVGAAVLGVVRHAWEQVPGFGGVDLVVTDGELAVAADASVYYRDDLRAALSRAGVRPTGPTPSHLIAAAYRAWGERCVEHLEGDFAFILWDGAAQRALCARDYAGRRPLYYAESGNTVVVASTIAALLAHPATSRELNLVAVAADAAGFFAEAHETCYRAVRVLPAGWSLRWDGGRPRLTRHWTPPPVREEGGLGFDAAAERLRGLLRDATAERLAPAGPTSVWLSGGWDSTAVFGAGELVLRERGTGEHLRAVSVSYPPGDVGREDELIAAVAGHWGSPVRWLDIADIPLLDRPAERAAERDEPFAHAFETGNRALAAGSVGAGARVAFDGMGGDQLFQVSPVYLADLLRTGRWVELAREWRRKGLHGRGFRTFFQYSVQPLLPAALLWAATLLRGGRPLRRPLERPVPPWMDASFVRRNGLVERERGNTPRRTSPDRAAYETYWYLSHPFFPRAFACVSEFALDAGVELRSPLYDRRVLEFAVTRPRAERSAGPETKRLLRRAMRGLLPDGVLAPRKQRTGLAGAYLARSLRRLHAATIEAVVSDSPVIMSELGIVNAAALRRCWNEYRRGGRADLAVSLFLTVQTELWLRARVGGPRACV